MNIAVTFLIYFLFFLYFQTTGIYGGDAGDLVTAAYTGSTAHPPGYPLYSLLGYLISHATSLSTVAWRIGLLSSIPAALVCTLVWLVVKRITGSSISGLATASLLGVNYIFWLYAIVPEVFSLHLLFMTAAVYIGYDFYQKPMTWKLIVLALLLGLGLSHHHMIILVVPSIMFLLMKRRVELYSSSPKTLLMIGAAFCLGLLLYIWAPITAFHAAPITWSNPVTFSNFVRLITRSEYGSFQSGTTYGQTIQSRLIQLPFLYEMFTSDHTIIGLCLFLIGIYWLWKKNRVMFFYFTSLLLIVGPGFFFYASYLFTTRFQIATAERFVLPMYVIASIMIGIGMHYVVVSVRKTLAFIDSQSNIHIRKFTRSITLSLYAVYALFIVMIFWINYPKISPLKFDYTAEHLGRDIIAPLEENSIILLKGDHAVFNTQYVHYVQGVRPDVALIHISKFLRGDMERQMETHHPDVKNPYSEHPLVYLRDFIIENRNTPIYATAPIELIPPDYVWVSMGLVYRLYPRNEVPSPTAIVAITDSYWETYHDPLSGSLSKYKNLMQSNMLDYYRNAHMRTGLYALQHTTNSQRAAHHLQQALRLDPEYKFAYYFLAEAYIQMGNCHNAQQSLDTAAALPDFQESREYIESRISLEKVCSKNEEQTEFWEDRLKTFSEPESVPLEEL